VLNPGTTYHLVGTYDGANARLYVDGALVMTAAATMAPNGGANVMRFGAYSTGPGQYWHGKLDDASFYSSTLTPTQVQAHYAASVTGSTATSAPSAVVAAVPPSNSSPPVVSGVAQEGSTLTASTGSWSGTAPISYTYQWQRCSPACIDITGASGTSYDIVAADVDSTLQVAVTGTNAGGSSAASSAQTATVVAGAAVPPSNSSLPVVSGVAREGVTLTASAGSWSGTAPISYTYQWQRCSPGCVDVVGATTSSYSVVAADVGSTLRISVTGTNSAGSSSASSAQTATVLAAGGGESTLTFSVSAGGDDGDVSVAGAQAAGYPPSGAAAPNASGSVFTAGRRLAWGEFEVLTALLRFDTSALPDNATVTSVRLRLHVTGTADANDRSLVGEWYSTANWPIDATDWTLSAGANALPGADITALVKNATAELNLTGPAGISLNGYTGLRLGISGGQPSGDNYVQISALEHPGKPEPQLIVTYTTP
jgi:hypothetical protein